MKHVQSAIELYKMHTVTPSIQFLLFTSLEHNKSLFLASFMSFLFFFSTTGQSRWLERCGTSSSLRLLRSLRPTSLKSICRGLEGSLSTGTPWMSVYLAKIWCPTICHIICTTMWPCGPKTSKFAHWTDQNKKRGQEWGATNKISNLQLSALNDTLIMLQKWCSLLSCYKNDVL